MASRPSSLRFARSRITGALSRHIPTKVLSLAIAVSIWAWVQSDEVVENRARVQVNYSWPKDLVNARHEPKTLVVTVSGPQGVVRTIERGHLSVDVDLSDAEPGIVPVDFSGLGLSGLPAGVQVIQVSPPAIDIELDRALTRSVAVQPIVIGTPRKGWTVGEITVDPPTARITGPQARIKEIVQCPTDVVDISGARGLVTSIVNLSMPDRVVRLEEGTPQVATVTIHIDPVIVERTFDSAPVLVRSPDHWLVTPSTARLVIQGPQTEVTAIRVDKVAVLLEPPNDLDSHGRATVTWRKNAADNPISISHASSSHDGPADDIEILRVDPRSFSVEIQP